MEQENLTIKTENIIKKALKDIDSEFDKMGRSITNPSMVDRYLLASTYKAVRLTKAIQLLCKVGQTEESFPILRSLIEHSINMRWITESDTKARLKEYLSDFSKKGFGEQWTNKSLLDRMNDVGFDGRDYFDFCVKLTYSYSHINAGALKWNEVIDDPRLSKDGWSSYSILVVVVQMLGHVMKALNSHFNGYFNGYDNIWSQVSVDKNIRAKVEKIRESFKP